jgi:hypothetical protein
MMYLHPTENLEGKKKRVSCRIKYPGGSFIEAGLIVGSIHPRNNIYIVADDKGSYRGCAYTVDEVADVIKVLAAAISDATWNKRDELAPKKSPKKSENRYGEG